MITVEAIQTGTVEVRPAMVRGRGPGPLRLINFLRDRSWSAPLPVLAWLIRHPEGPIVVDTGERAATAASSIARFAVSPEQEIGAQLRQRGVDPAAVRHVVLTHLHGDHMNGAGDFPAERLVLAEAEYQAATRGWSGWLFRNLVRQPLPRPFAPRLVRFGGRPLGPFAQSHPLTADGRVALVPTPGHTLGHASVVVQGDELHYFLAGDLTYTQDQLLAGFLSGNTLDVRGQRHSMAAVRSYAATWPTVYLPSHDPESPRRLSEGLALKTTTAPLRDGPVRT